MTLATSALPASRQGRTGHRWRQPLSISSVGACIPPVTATGRFLALSLMLVVVAACGDKAAPIPSTGSSVAADPSVTASGIARRGRAGSRRPGPGAGAGGDASGDLITAAYEAGTIDRPTALLYRLQAIVGDDRLPAEYAARRSRTSAAATIVVTEWDTFTDAQQRGVPALRRPAHGSPERVRRCRSTATTGRPAAAAMTLASSTRAVSARSPRTPAWTASPAQEVPGLPVVVWGQCGGLSERLVLGLGTRSRPMSRTAWDPLVRADGRSRSATPTTPTDTFPDAPEGNDGLLDVYVVAGSVGGRARSITTDALATTYPAAPLGRADDGPHDERLHGRGLDQGRRGAPPVDDRPRAVPCVPVRAQQLGG